MCQTDSHLAFFFIDGSKWVYSAWRWGCKVAKHNLSFQPLSTCMRCTLQNEERGTPACGRPPQEGGNNWNSAFLRYRSYYQHNNLCGDSKWHQKIPEETSHWLRWRCLSIPRNAQVCSGISGNVEFSTMIRSA